MFEGIKKLFVRKRGSVVKKIKFDVSKLNLDVFKKIDQ